MILASYNFLFKKVGFSASVLCVVIAAACDASSPAPMKEAAASRKYVDREVLEKLNAGAILPAASVDYIYVATQEFRKNHGDIDDYAVKVEMDDKFVLVTFFIPRMGHVLDGGAVRYKLGRQDRKILETYLFEEKKEIKIGK